MKKTILLVAAVIFVNLATAQIKVSGKVTSSEDGAPVPYANILVKGVRGVGATTDLDGVYSFDNLSRDAVLVVSYIGYVSQEVSINGRSVVNISLDVDSRALDEVMVVAYGTATRGTFTGSAAVVKSDNIKDIPSSSFESMLQGKVPGLKWSPGSGQAGSSVNMRIRGTGSMNAGNEPLYVIDGVPVIQGNVSNLSMVSFNIMNTLNPADIESFTVLKDAAASALYGSRAANGVILITTKKGKDGRLKINFKTTLGFTPCFAYNNWELPTNEQQREIYYDVYYNQYLDDGKTPSEAAVHAQSIMETNLPLDSRGFFDWEDALLRTALYQNYDLNLSGADENTSYFTSFAYMREEGRVATNNMDRITGRLNVSKKIVKNLEFTTNISIAGVKKDGFNDTYNNNTNYFQNLRNQFFGEYWPYYPDGTPNTSRYKSYSYNYLYYDDLQENYSKMFRTTLNETIKWTIIPGLVASTLFSYDLTRVDDHNYYSPLHHRGSASNGTVTEISNKYQKMVSSSTINYNKVFRGKHILNFLAGFEVETNNTDYVWANGTNLPNAFSKTIITAGSTTSEGYSWGNRLVSLLSKLEYSYDDKYYFSSSFRRDGSSRLGANTRWGNFWSVAGSWRMKNEKFLKNINWITNLRIKGSYGVNGTLPNSNYGHLALYSYGYNYLESPGGVVTSVADPDLSWETNYTYNIGFESSFFDGRLAFNAEFFNRDSKNLLQDVEISRITGFSTILTNFGAMNNKGVELDLSGDIVRNADWQWNVGINASFIKSKVSKLYGGADIIRYDPTGGDKQAQFLYTEGKSPMSFWGKEWAGVDPETGNGMFYMNNDKPGDGTYNGRAITYNASNATNVITGCSDPDVFGGINTSLRWKDLSLDMNFSYSLGGDIYNSFERYVNDDGYFSNRTRAAKVVNRWKKPGDITDVPRITYEAVYSFFSHTSRWLYKNNYIRLKDISLSYNLPSGLLKKVYFSNIRVFASATNLWTLASQDYFDPEGNVYGVQSWQMPIGKTITFGLDITF